MSELVDTVAQRHGRLDVAVNNAGVVDTGTLDEFDLAQWNRLASINITGVLLAMKHQIRAMKAQGGGAIVNIGSILGAHTSMPGMGAYSATKAAVSALSRSAALDHARDGIRVNVVSPGPVDTAMSFQEGESVADRDQRLKPVVPRGHIGTVAEIAAAILWLAGPGAGFTVGHDLVVDGGVTA